mgnify:CR=1 FL=1
MDMETDEQQKARMELYNALLEGLSDIKAGRVRSYKNVYGKIS